MKHIRNFCIIAHIDHGKSTLADRLLEVTGTIDKKDMRAQLLDSMDLERERGITIKSHAIQMTYPYGGTLYTLNLIDTPGHVDFSYEVSRSVAACEGALLVVDASQGIEAQTISNLYLAREQNLTIIPVLNKVDLPTARIEEVGDELVGLLGCSPEEIIHASGKEGIGIDKILAAIVQQIPPPQGDPDAPLQAMVFDALYNPFRGVEVYIRLLNGTLAQHDTVCFLQTGHSYVAEELGILKQKPLPQPRLSAGNVGYFVGNIKQASEVKIGDTVTHVDHPCHAPVQGFAEVKPMVFAGVYPVQTSEYEPLRKALEKLRLNDAALVWQPETSVALGFGFRCGFLGMLHMDITKERLSRESGVEIIVTIPSVELQVLDRKGETHLIHTPAELPPPEHIQTIAEPVVEAHIITKSLFMGPVIELCVEKRGTFKNQTFLTPERVEIVFELPLAEIVFDFYDKLKSLSKGYASLDYKPIGFHPSQLIKLDILLNGQKVDALSTIIHRDRAYRLGRQICEKAKDIIPQHQFEVRIQAAIGSKIIASTALKALRKDVTGHLYGGDRSRKDKLLEAQKRGKKKMRQIGKVSLPKEAFLSLLRVDN